MFRRLLKIRLKQIFGLLALSLLAVSFCAAAGNPGFYRVEKQSGVWWFITPDGKRFFSNGVNVVTKGQSRENYNPKNPEYAAFRHYSTTEAWTDATLKRLREWNFNTIGGWSSEEITNRGAMPYTKVLHISSKNVPWGDLFGEKVAAEIDIEARREIGGLKDDKNLIGYFTDNELGWWDDSVFQFFLKESAENKTRKVLMNLLRRHYKNNFNNLKLDFETGKTQSFAALERTADLSLKPNGNGTKVIDKFIFLVAQRYYKLAHDAVRRYDPNHLILGDRYPSWYSQSVVRASIPYIDVVSTNYMADWTDGGISRFYLETLHRLTGKPVIVTEYYMTATQNRSGNKNSSAGFPVVETQSERAISFRNNLTAFAELPYVVGAHWFQYTDEPTNGRSDGEDYNMGLVDINDQPYEELTATAELLKPEMIHAKTADAPKNNFIPKAGTNVEKSLREWNKKSAFVGGDSKNQANLPFADLYICWDKDYLYLAIYASDFLEDRIYKEGVVPQSEKMLAAVKIGMQKQPLQIRFGHGEPNISGANVEYKSVESSTRSTILLKIPARIFDKSELKAGDNLQLKAALTSHSRAETMKWNQVLKLGEAVSE